MILFKQKVKPDEQTIIQLLKYFQVPIPRGNGVLLDLGELKKPDFLYLVNLKMIQKLFKVLNQENNQNKPESSTTFFKFYVGTGNNYPTVRQIIRRRNWWHREKQERWIGQHQNHNNCEESDNEEEEVKVKGAHFLWTQWRKPELTEFLKQNQG